ncbi:putative alkaline protease 1 [Pyronema domesticum]|uniref:Similar to Alkaline protease 1 acc. no. P28296 n=1 Tax=Pyronema omphalodes (strain CBS 100304) TaxID=1076935 RepID=U4LTM1_PYROM|nr:putative alkaline protease 1 [Pyronema domesticum]CCX30906.1 Similar to Alkaline protease 1; acc. no. P28296 [Pyronema omphalodes CBS 100304]
MVNFVNFFAAVVALVPFVAAAPLTVTVGPVTVSVLEGTVIPDNYIVVLKDGISDAQYRAHQEWANSRHSQRLFRRNDPSLSGIEREYHLSSLLGYAGVFDQSTIDEIQARPEVAYVEPDRVMVAYDVVSQRNAPWGIARISQEALENSNTYKYQSTAGAGVTAYVIDTGINTAHVDFEGRAIFGTNVVGGSNGDGQGHGTHVAGIIGGKTYGVAKKATIVAVKVLKDDGSGTTSGVISGVEWVTKDAKGKKAVANMSLGGVYSASLNRAVDAAIQAGITFAVAAGNNNKDAKDYSPASVAAALTVGATDKTDSRASYSNFGSFVDVFAPGSNIPSAWIGSTTAQNTLSGTSMATPHISGLAAYLIGLEGLTTPAAVVKRIKDLSVSGVVTNAGVGSVDSLAYNGVKNPPPSNSNPPPSNPPPSNPPPSNGGLFGGLLGGLI